MIEAKKILQLVRYKTGDNNELKYSDYDIKNALNESLRYITQTQAMQNSDYLETSTVFDEAELNKKIKEETPDYDEEDLYDFRLKGLDLPEDYCTLAGVTNVYGRDLKPVDITQIPKPVQFKITGNKIYVGVPKFMLTYKKTLPEITNINEDSIELPQFCIDIIVKTTVMILKQEQTDIMLSVVERMVQSIIPRRRYNNAEVKMPFYC